MDLIHRRVYPKQSQSPSPPSDGGEGRGEEACQFDLPLSPALSPLVPRGERVMPLFGLLEASLKKIKWLAHFALPNSQFFG